MAGETSFRLIVICSLLVFILCDLDEDWFSQGKDSLRLELNKIYNKNVAKNVILFIGDGLGLTTTTLARIYKGQKAGLVGETTKLAYDKFPHVALSKTYSNNMQVTESAAAATAFLSGTKATSTTLGLGPKSREKNCSGLEENKISSILDWAMDAGKGSGIISTSRITDATPAAAYAHSPYREWESDVPDYARGLCTDIAHQLVVDNPNINVLMGGGRRAFIPSNTIDPEETSRNGTRVDGRNLIQEWIDDKERRGLKHSYVWKEDDFRSIDTSRTDYLLGLFSSSYMNFEIKRKDDIGGEPSLAAMTETAIRILKKQAKGFFLLVEAGRIDHGNHYNQAKWALEDTLAFDEAITKAIELTNEEDTLMIVTGDHSSSINLGGFSSINNPILDVVDQVGFDRLPTNNGEPYLGVSYANGPGPAAPFNLTGVDTTADDFKFPVQVQMEISTHAGEDVGIYARGPMSHLINGVQDNHYIAHVMAYAACIGDDKSHCSDMNLPTTPNGVLPSGGYWMSSVWITCIVLFNNLV